MILEQVTLRVAAQSSTAFEVAFADGSHLISDAPGCRSVELLRSADEPGRYLLRVGWNSVADHTENYVGTVPHAKLSAILGAYITEVLGSDHVEAEPVVRSHNR